ncbi:MAG: MFS transporter, partial [Acidimicrobiia bacterium]
DPGGRASRLIFGPQETRRLSVLHLCQALGDGFFAVSLAGSLFFSVSIDAARPNILAYLLLTMAPFAVLAPLIGPMIDRVAQGYPRVVAGANLVRATLCLLLALHLRTLLFYPEALGVLVGAKTYSVAKAALVPRLQPRRELLLSTNARLSRMGAVGAALGGGTGAGVIALVGAEASVLLAAAAFLTSGLLALRLPLAEPPEGVVAAEEFEELHDPDVLAAAASVAVLRAATGFLAFFVAFHLKRSGASPWLFGLVAGMSTLAAVTGTIIGPRLRRKYQERTLLRGALVLPAVCCLIGSARIAIGVLIVCVMAMGIGGNVGRLAFDSIVQANAPDVDRGRAFARFETRFQLAWVAGAVGPVGLRVPAWAGLLVTALLLAAGALLFGVERSALLRWRRSALTVPDLPRSVLEQARRLQASGQYAHAVLEAALLLELCPPCCDAKGPAPDLDRGAHGTGLDEPDGSPDDGAEGPTAATATLREQRDLALAGLAGPREAQRAVNAAAVLHAFSVLRPAPRSTSRPMP